MEGKKNNILRYLVYLLGTMFMIGSLGCISLAADVYAMDEQTEVTTWEELQATFNKGGEIILKRSVTAGQSDGPLIIPGGVQVTLNLNGRNIDRGLENAEARSDGCIIINNGRLTITDSSYGYKGRITGGNNSGDGGGIVNKGVLVLENGTITHNKAGKSGGGIHNTGRLTMTGGIISYNTAVSFHGGGIYNSGTLTLSGGQIQKNEASKSEESKGQGGGILQNGTMEVSGNPIVKDNAAGHGDNIYLRAEHPTMTVTGAFTDGAILGVTSARKKGVITSNYSRYNGQDKDPQFIFNSDEGYLIRLINDEAKIVSGASLVRYFRRSWDGSKVDRTFIETDEYTLMSDVKDSGSTQLETGLYIARDNITFKNRIGVAPGAEVTLVLCDSSNLTMKKGIRVNGSKSKLIICGQTFDSGVLEAASGSDTPIGADSKKEGGIIEIHGGSITAKTKGENPSAAIGGAKKSTSSGIIRIYGGGVEAAMAAPSRSETAGLSLPR